MTLRVLLAAAVLVSVPLLAQEPEPQPPPQSRDIRTINIRPAEVAVEVPEPPDPPAGADAWSLRVTTTGGFTGMGVGSVTIASDGSMSCGPGPCATPLTAALLSPVAKAITSLIDAVWIRRTPSGVCRDCVQTTMALKRREGDTVRVFLANWDDTQSPSPELRELRRLAFELRAARSGR